MGKIKRRELEQRISDQEDEIVGLKSDLEDAVYANGQLSSEVSKLNDDLTLAGEQIEHREGLIQTAEALAFLDELEIKALQAALEVEAKGPIMVNLTTIDFQDEEAQAEFLDLVNKRLYA